MNIGLYIKWQKGSLERCGNVLGDELYGESICDALLRDPRVNECRLYAPNFSPQKKLDVMVYLNDSPPNDRWAHKHVIYMQNAYGVGSDILLREFQRERYDGYTFISYKLLDLHKNAGYNGIYLPFGVDTTLFYPRTHDRRHTFDIAYVGNDIKGVERTCKYILPAVRYNFGLFGNWEIKPFYRRRFWRNWRKTPEYKKVLNGLCRGKIPQQDVPILYSSSKINLNCTAQDCVDWDVITLRVLEVLACKGFLITDKVRTAEKLMKNCMVFTNGGEDLTDKINYYLRHDKLRREIANEGYDYVTKHASIEARMRVFIDYIETIL